jgi:endonuclease/exonuclease/phosphatase family metal-dependent hydrolase
MEITVGTANIAGAARQEVADPGKYSLLAGILGGTDVLGLQEVVRKVDARIVLFCCTQLSTLTEEAEDRRRSTPNARALRSHQVGWIVDYIKSYQEARRGICNELKQEWVDEPVILVGDFNADKESPELSRLCELGLKAVKATRPNHTHRKHRIEMDLIFAPGKMRGSAQVIKLDDLESSNKRGISDHYPVIATLNI